MMNKKKKTALYLACEESFGADCRCSDCLLPSWDLCKKNKESKYYGMTCIEAFVQSYKDRADIPDGWDVVKKNYKLLDKEYNKLTEKYSNDCLGHCFKNIEEQRNRWADCQAIFNKKSILYDLLQEAGIEVE